MTGLTKEKNMKVVILSGGTGSIALQKGLHQFVDGNRDSRGLDIDVIVNAYDNGLSTGAVRRVLDGKILGPSDVRKNQAVLYELTNKQTPFLHILNHRFTVNALVAEKLCCDVVSQVEEAKSHAPTLLGAIRSFFSLPIATKIDYDDFSLANIIYAGLALQNGNSLRAAASIMADVLGIEDRVLLNDDRSLFLGAITKSGVKISDEGDIVSWNNEADPIVDIFFIDDKGNIDLPILELEARSAIQKSDVLILSSGTQWSSLIPTYESVGFKELMDTYQGKIIMVMNRVPDKDAPGAGADDIISSIIPRYFKPGTIDLIVDSTSSDMMRIISRVELLKSVNEFKLNGQLKPSLHNAAKLCKAVLSVIFKDYVGNHYVFDYDDTLVGRGHTFAEQSKQNVGKLNELNDKTYVSICTGNGIKALNLDRLAREPDDKKTDITIYADGGINQYEYDNTARLGNSNNRPYSFKTCIFPVGLSEDQIKNILLILKDCGIPAVKIENRASAMIVVKPIDPEYREITRNLIDVKLNVLNDQKLKVKSVGRTSIEISNPELSKVHAIQHILKGMYPDEILVYVGDELSDGNDSDIRKLAETDKRIRCLRVKNPADTLLFLTSLEILNA